MTSADAAPPYTDSRQIWDTSWEGISTYPVADTSCTILARLEGMDQRYDDTGTRVADSVAKSDGTTRERSDQKNLHCRNVRTR